MCSLLKWQQFAETIGGKDGLFQNFKLKSINIAVDLLDVILQHLIN